MPFYDYYCEDNNKTVEVYHSMNKRLKTWQEVCNYAHIELGDTQGSASVVRLCIEANPMIFRLKGLDKDEPSNKLTL